MPTMEWWWVTAASWLAGFVDAIVGGGGLILVPTLFATFAQTPPATLFGTGKGASVWGTAFASWQYQRRVALRTPVLVGGAVAAFATSLLGAWMVTVLPATLLRKALPFVLLVVLLYTLWRKDLGRTHTPRWHGRREVLASVSLGGVIGWYDGFFGPGTGSFLVFLFVRLLGYDFLRASAAAKLLNTASNTAALLLFAFKGHVWWWPWVVSMALANVAGSLVGTRLALRRGAGFVRAVFIVVVSSLILKTGYDAFLR